MATTSSSPSASASASGSLGVLTNNNNNNNNKIEIEAGHQMFREGNYWEALNYYTEALSLAKTNPQKIALHSNRAACFLKLHLFHKAAEECTWVLELDHNHTGALMLRAQTLVTLKDYHSALFDVNRLMELNPSSEAYHNLEFRLRTQLSLAPIPESEAEFEEEQPDESELSTHKEEQEDAEEDKAVVLVGTNKEKESCGSTLNGEVVVTTTATLKDVSVQSIDKSSEPRKSITAEVIAQARRKVEPRKTLVAEAIAQARKTKQSFEQHPGGWQAIPKPKGHSALDYARWDRVEDDSSDDDDDDDNDDTEDSLPQYRFRVRKVGVSSVK